MESIELEVETGGSPTVADLTDRVRSFCHDRGDGLVSVFVPHATAGVAIIETGAGSDTDLLAAIDDVLPADRGRWRHEHGAPGHGRDHVLPAFVSPSLTVPVLGGRPALGTWQSIVLVDTNIDNRHRRVRLSFLAG
ncbi:MAG: YjbQ family protein [Acidimicrobiia bacterium]